MYPYIENQKTYQPFLQENPELVGGWATNLKNISQIGSSPQVWVKKEQIWNHHLVNDFVQQDSFRIINGISLPGQILGDSLIHPFQG